SALSVRKEILQPDGPDFETMPGYKCELLHDAWCTPPAVNPGDTYRENGMVKCCTRIEPEVQSKQNPMDAFEKEAWTPEPPESLAKQSPMDAFEKENQLEAAEEVTTTTMPPSDDERTALCGVASFKAESFMRRGKPVTACRNKDTGKFAKAICCK
ncbi:lss, partial [Symbiodinium pilosum]